MAINPREFDTDEKYFEDTTHMSVSRYKRLNRCEVAGMLDYGEPSEAMMIGSYVDAHVSGNLDKFIKDNPDIISSRGPTKGKLKAAFRQAEEICEFIDNDPVFQDFMSGEKQTVMTGEIEGVPFKAKFDIYSEGIAINDLKVMRSITDRSGEYYDFITPWGYDIQMAVYQELAYQNTGERLPTYICVVTKEDPINSAIIKIDQDTLDLALARVIENVSELNDVLQGNVFPTGCGKCNTCIYNRKVTPIIHLEELQKPLDII